MVNNHLPWKFFLAFLHLLPGVPLLVAVKVVLGHHLGKALLLFLFLFRHRCLSRQPISRLTDSVQLVAHALYAVGLCNLSRWIGFYQTGFPPDLKNDLFLQPFRRTWNMWAHKNSSTWQFCVIWFWFSLIRFYLILHTPILDITD